MVLAGTAWATWFVRLAAAMPLFLLVPLLFLAAAGEAAVVRPG